MPKQTLSREERLWDLRRQAREVYVMDQGVKALEAESKALRNALADEMEAAGESKVEFDFPVDMPDERYAEFVGTSGSVTLSGKTKITYDPDEVERRVEGKLGRTVARTIVRRSYAVSDPEGLFRYVRELGGSPSELRAFLSVSKAVNEDELSRAYEFGNVTLDDLEGAYEVERGRRYVTVRTHRKKS